MSLLDNSVEDHSRILSSVSLNKNSLYFDKFPLDFSSDKSQEHFDFRIECEFFPPALSNNDLLPDKNLLKNCENLENETFKDFNNNFETLVDNYQEKFASLLSVLSNKSSDKNLLYTFVKPPDGKLSAELTRLFFRNIREIRLCYLKARF